MKTLQAVIILCSLSILIFSGCTKNDELLSSDEISKQERFKEGGEPGNEYECEAEVFIYPLLAGNMFNAGNVTITNDDEVIIVEYTAGSGWKLSEINFWIGDSSDVPVDAGNAPDPGLFTYSQKFSSKVLTYKFQIPLSDVNSEDLVFLAHAKVLKGKTREIAWADGGIRFASFFGINQWGYLGKYQVQYCNKVDKYFTAKFYVKNERGETFWCGLNNQQPFFNTGNWCDKLSVVPLASGTYDLVLYNNQYEFDYGYLTLDVNGSNVTINAVSTFPKEDFVMYTMHAFIGTMEELDALKGDYGCPNYLSFPYILQQEGNEIEIEYNIN
ncbi:MAG: hypothetical protein MI922_22820 [Bacteroidales bacterium]|nr:hypothetical protein [Bacteroidales bacterium]